MKHPIPLQLSRSLLDAAGISVSLHNLERIPTKNKLLIVSNHRSLLDAPLLMTAIGRPVRFACHYYMSQVPLLQQAIALMGAFPLEADQRRQASFFRQSARFLQANQVVGVFPEGADPMVKTNAPQQLSPFYRGFAHLALKVPVDGLAILPIAIASREEKRGKLAPLALFRRFDPSEALFQRDGWHSAILYRHVDVLFGHPLLIDESWKSRYRGSGGATTARELTQACWSQIAELLAR
ncbi:1-acyl-sn-glycerol-3-phosphate acyltransferase [Cyanobium sp. BA5m-21]|uniref:lysophospholipid acyltransferase family protein n=1 Tax=unclassified Cyanobium TaxID=2627006 RepID=UPI0020CF1FF0|nr:MULTISPECIES: lysophospholipid acyltransferase family protein [unclassified Cyanobium]MCP9904250.1 1-acyl-sn-glycerol-3-phosphate acyltransferase [Cyanobium sp. BA5m-10]MCP9908218.1 1-acyl-sn-glycerol-3-phosphate acyltransferase [Cyanobium sp. BA5m-21]